MRLQRFFISEKIGDKKTITINSADMINQISRVFRLKGGDHIILFDNSGFDYEGALDNALERTILISIKTIDVCITNVRPSRYVSERGICLYASIIKKSNFETVVEKVTELGVSRIVPVLSSRSEKKSLNEERLKKIAIEASEQSGRGVVPEMSKISTLGEALQEVATLGRPRTSFAFHTEGKPWNKAVVEEKTDLAFFIGPEGGWTTEEIEMFHRSGVEVVCLGKQILRAETAAIVAVAQAVF